MTFILTVLSGMFVTNLLLYKLDGMTFYTQEEKIENVVHKGLKIAFVTVLTVLLVYPINEYLLKKVDLTYLIPIFVIVGIYSINYCIDLIFKKSDMKVFEMYNIKHFVFLNSIAFISAIVGVYESSLLLAVGVSLGLTLGHLLIMLLVLSILPKVTLPSLPKCFKGIPAMIIMMALIAMAFTGLAGLL